MDWNGISLNYCYANDWRRHVAASAQLHRKHIIELNWTSVWVFSALPATFSSVSHEQLTRDADNTTQQLNIRPYMLRLNLFILAFWISKFKSPTKKKWNAFVGDNVICIFMVTKFMRKCRENIFFSCKRRTVSPLARSKWEASPSPHTTPDALQLFRFSLMRNHAISTLCSWSGPSHIWSHACHWHLEQMKFSLDVVRVRQGHYNQRIFLHCINRKKLRFAAEKKKNGTRNDGTWKMLNETPM